MAPAETTEDCGIGIRGVALTIDAFVWFLLFFVATTMVAAPSGDLVMTQEGLNADLEGPPAQVAFLLWLALSIGYHTLTEWRYEKTVGKHLVKIEVVDEDGSPVTLRQSLVRNVARLVDVLPFFYVVGMILVATSDRHQRLGDRLVNTVVVRP